MNGNCLVVKACAENQHFRSFLGMITEVCFKSFVTKIIKLHNFFDICGRCIIESIVERFFTRQFQYKQKAQKILKFQRSQGRQKIKAFPQGTYMAQNFIPKTSATAYSIPKGISKIYQLEIE